MAEGRSLEAGKGFAPTGEGTPQGGIISPLLLNIALHGLEEAAGVRYRAGTQAGRVREGCPAVTRYADNLVVCCHSRQQAEQVKARLAGWLEPRGLAFNEAKTRIVPLSEGFDFLGFNLRRYPNGKLLINRGAMAIKRFRNRLALEFRALRGFNIAAVLAKIVPITRGWVAYYRTVVSARVFAALTEYLWKLTYKWACWSHPNKPKYWIARPYYGKINKSRNDRWVFGDRNTGAYLPKPAWTAIVRHILVKGGASPDDPALAAYWAQRHQKVKPPLEPHIVRLLSRQDGRCSLCGKTCWPQTSPPSPPRAGNTGSCRSPGRRSRRTTWSITTRPAPHETTGHTSYTPPATGANIRPGQQETPWCSRTPEPPSRLAWAACRDEWHARS